MKVKIIAVMVAVAALFIGTVLWRTDSFVYGDRMSWVESQTRTQLGAINYSLATELKSLQRVVANFNSENFQKGKINWSSLAPYYAVASFSISGKDLEPQALVVKENSKAAAWTKEFVKSAVGNLQGRTPEMRYFIKPFQDSQRGRYVAVLLLDGSRAYALIGSGETFQSMIDAQRGALSAFSIVTSTGLTVGHSIPEYLGTIMRDDPVFKDAQKSGSSHGSNTYQLKSGPLYGMYEIIPQSNLYVLSSAPLADTMKGRTGLWWQFILMGGGLVLVAVASILAIVMPSEKEREKLEQDLLEAKAKPAMVAASEKVVALDPEIAQKEKLDASMRVASALAHEMRGPLASILGYSQMILAKAPEEEIVQSAESIVRETRGARSILDKLLGYAGEEIQEKNSMKLEGPLVKALKASETLFAHKGVKLTKNFQDTSAMDLHVDAIIRALGNILQNSVEAMERMAKKEVKVDLYEDTQGTHLIIEDTGEGIEAQNVEKIFDPFFTTRSFQNHMGLGLSVAFGILKEHNAEVQVESQRGQGTKISILFKKQQTASVLKSPEFIEEKKEAVVMAVDLPQLAPKSEHREEAEAEYKEVLAAQPQAASPLDVNIDKLLELPEQGDGFSFNDGFLGDQEESSSAKSAPAGASAFDDKAASNRPTAEELEAMDDEPIVAAPNFITPPTASVAKKVSKLDSYQVEIRRPGKRL